MFPENSPPIEPIENVQFRAYEELNVAFLGLTIIPEQLQSFDIERTKKKRPLDRATEIARFIQDLWDRIPAVQEYMQRFSHPEIVLVRTSKEYGGDLLIRGDIIL